jgi:O-methyltransferase
MVPPDVFVSNLILTERVSTVPGCIIECGVWRGGMSAGIAIVLGPHRQYFLFDSFEGLPPAKEIDGKAALRWQQDKQSISYYDNCSASPEYARHVMNLSGIRSFELVKGWFDTTLPEFSLPTSIALLRLDCDWYDSVMVCLESLFDHVTPGGLILLDDYYVWDGCSRALHDFLARRSATERIRNLGDICYLQKAAPS